MFIGHYALGLAAKRLAPRTSLGTLFVAPTLADLLWPVFLLLGWERVSPSGVTNPFLTLTFDAYPISHSLLALIGWGALYALLYRARTGYGRGAIVVGLLVVSHWVLDFATHVPDMPLYPGGPKVGLGLWHSVPHRPCPRSRSAPWCSGGCLWWGRGGGMGIARRPRNPRTPGRATRLADPAHPAPAPSPQPCCSSAVRAGWRPRVASTRCGRA